jgi:hypothetical protein
LALNQLEEFRHQREKHEQVLEEIRKQRDTYKQLLSTQHAKREDSDMMVSFLTSTPGQRIPVQTLGRVDENPFADVTNKKV